MAARDTASRSRRNVRSFRRRHKYTSFCLLKRSPKHRQRYWALGQGWWVLCCQGSALIVCAFSMVVHRLIVLNIHFLNACYQSPTYHAIPLFFYQPLLGYFALCTNETFGSLMILITRQGLPRSLTRSCGGLQVFVNTFISCVWVF